MIIGIGTDIIEIERIKEAMLKSERFIPKLFTENEIQYFKKRNFLPEVVAGGFAAKEAVAKAFGTGFRGVEFKDIEVQRDSLGKPEVKLYRQAAILASEKGDFKIHLSISHSRENATAFAVWEKI